MRLKYTVSIEDLILMGVDPEDAHCWIIARKKNVLTTSALKLVMSEAAKIGWTLAQAVKYSAEHGYIGFKAHYVKPEDFGVQKTIDVDFKQLHTDKKWREGLQ